MQEYIDTNIKKYINMNFILDWLQEDKQNHAVWNWKSSRILRVKKEINHESSSASSVISQKHSTFM
jgi:hypothetical protein